MIDFVPVLELARESLVLVSNPVDPVVQAAAGVAVEEAVLAQVVVDAPQALVPVGELIRHALWLLWDTVYSHRQRF